MGRTEPLLTKVRRLMGFKASRGPQRKKRSIRRIGKTKRRKRCLSMKARNLKTCMSPRVAAKTATRVVVVASRRSTTTFKRAGSNRRKARKWSTAK
jgi:hypothetical protein